jgi:hypothetical protein
MENIKEFWKEHQDIITDNFLNVVKSDFSEDLKREIMKRQLKDLIFGLEEMLKQMEVKNE